MMSATREERVIIVAGIIAGFVGLALGLAHGGLSLTAGTHAGITRTQPGLRGAAARL